jgi:hypothetical protein
VKIRNPYRLCHFALLVAVKRIFIKELSMLRLRKPACALLTAENLFRWLLSGAAEASR